VLMNPGINSGDTISAIPDGIGYSYRLEIVVLMTPLYFAINKKRGLSFRLSGRQERTEESGGKSIILC